jgi:hypothetical protein
MDTEKRFAISNWERVTAVSVPLSLGRILLREEVKLIAKSFGSRVNTSPNFSLIDVIPPIPPERLQEFGEALVELAWKLDPTEPKPDYKIN